MTQHERALTSESQTGEEFERLMISQVQADAAVTWQTSSMAHVCMFGSASFHVYVCVCVCLWTCAEKGHCGVSHPPVIELA